MPKTSSQVLFLTCQLDLKKNYFKILIEQDKFQLLLDWNKDSAEKGLWADGTDDNEEDWDVAVDTGDENNGGGNDDVCWRVILAIVDVVILLLLKTKYWLHYFIAYI